MEYVDAFSYIRKVNIHMAIICVHGDNEWTINLSHFTKMKNKLVIKIKFGASLWRTFPTDVNVRSRCTHLWKGQSERSKEKTILYLVQHCQKNPAFYLRIFAAIITSYFVFNKWKQTALVTLLSYLMHYYSLHLLSKGLK